MLFAWNYVFNAVVDNMKLVFVVVVIIDHPRSGVVCNFGPVCLFVCFQKP